MNDRQKILFMDDEDIILQVTSLMFNSLGHEIKCVKNGEEAVSIYQQSVNEGAPYSLIILDIRVPNGMGASETLKKLKEIDPSVKAVVTSGNPSDDIMIDYHEYGFKGSLVKPFSISLLSELLINVK
jgi:DNA-binding NtrC family response regulator